MRVDDSCPLGYDPSWLKFARVSMYSEMDSIDDFYPRTGRLKAPYYVDDPVRAEVPSGNGIKGRYGESKWYYSSRTDWDNYGENSPPTFAGPREYEFIGDSKTFYFFNSLESYYVGNQKMGKCFGEYIDIDSVNNINNHILNRELNFEINENTPQNEIDDTISSIKSIEHITNVYNVPAELDVKETSGVLFSA